MKVIPKKELITILEALPVELAFKGTVEYLFDRYGDDYFRDTGEIDWEKCNENTDRIVFLKELEQEKEIDK